jgi:pyruvate ferredoxin oxidoreductase gamma subunit
MSSQDKKMLEILIQGRGGQGAQTAGNLLATAFHEEGKYVQTFASYGGARRGTPVNSFLRVSDNPIRLRCSIERPAAILCFDESLLPDLLQQFADGKTLVVVNSKRDVEYFSRLGDYNIIPIDALRIAQKNNMGRIVNSALLGSIAGVLGSPAIDLLKKVVESSAPVKSEQNVAACADAYNHTKNTFCMRVES